MILDAPRQRPLSKVFIPLFIRHMSTEQTYLTLQCNDEGLEKMSVCCSHRYELKWIRGECERGVANSGIFGSVSQVYAIGHIRLPQLIKIQCFKGASQLCTLD